MMKNLLTLVLVLLSLSLSAQIESIGLIGTATPNGWDADTNMVQDMDDPNLWRLSIELVDGEAKFRANDDWELNWGSLDFPSGIGEQGGSNIPVFAGKYDITFNSETGEYLFDVDSPIGIIGSATPNGWDADTDMFNSTENPNEFFVVINLTAEELKFRKDDDWAVNWGGEGFPTDTATLDGPNIMVSKAGEYFVTFDTATAVYNFTENVKYESIGIIGSATAGGWDEDTDLTQSLEDPNVWGAELDLLDGEAKFRANDAWTLNWGGETFPSGTATLEGSNIPVTAGKYRISFNVETGDYSFLEIVEYASVGVVGTAVNGNFETVSALEKVTEDGYDWSMRMELIDGQLLFVADNDIAINWGSGDFPMGTAERNGPPIPTIAGDYIIHFNTVTGAFVFEEVIEYDAVSLVGKSGPTGAWPGDDASNDSFMDRSDDDPHLWTATGITLTSYEGASDEGVKFRADTAWTINWGAEDFPQGTGTQNGPNIQTVAGTYDIVFNSLTGEYLFGEEGTVSSNKEIINPSEIKVFPNPARQEVFVNLEKLSLSGELLITIYDIKGSEVFRSNQMAQSIIRVNTIGLNTGNYFIRIVGENTIVGKQLSIQK